MCSVGSKLLPIDSILQTRQFPASESDRCDENSGGEQDLGASVATGRNTMPALESAEHWRAQLTRFWLHDHGGETVNCAGAYGTKSQINRKFPISDHIADFQKLASDGSIDTHIYHRMHRVKNTPISDLRKVGIISPVEWRNRPLENATVSAMRLH